MSSEKIHRARLVDAIALNEEVRHFIFEVAGEHSFDFKPGQYVRLSRQFEEGRQDRYYSIASAPNGTNRFELCLNPVRDPGPFGRYLAEITPGGEVEVHGPYGGFRLKAPLRTSIFVATGTGITPFRSMFRYLLGSKQDRSGGAELTLLFGARTPELLLYRDEFEELERRHANFRFWPTLSGAPEGWPGRRGYVQRHLDEALGGKREGVDVYLCGRQEMVNEVREKLLRAGFDEDSILCEKYE